MQTRAEKLWHAWIVLSFSGLLAALFCSTLPDGLWEDGYFVKRFAYNFWHHGSLAWNPSDGPVYGMTSQTLQLLGVLIYAIDSRHVVAILLFVLCAALVAGLLVIVRSAQRRSGSPLGLIPAAAALSLPLLLELVPSGLETALTIGVVALSIDTVIGFIERRVRLWIAALLTLLVYWTRPDAVLIPVVLLAVLGYTERRRALQVARVIAVGLALSLIVCHVYYGTALPLPFYVKTRGISNQSAIHLAVFAPEKIKNAIQAGFLVLPFVFVALHVRSRLQLGLLASGLALAGYHYFATVETMGHLSRFYMPALVPVWMAAVFAYPAYVRKRRVAVTCMALVVYLIACAWLARLDTRYSVPIVLAHTRFYPYLAACAIMLLAPTARTWLGYPLLGITLWVSALVSYPPHRRDTLIEDDETILLREISPRLVFRGLAKLRDRVQVHALFHTDMGAPGILFPEARVVDLDGLLSEAIALHHARFEDLCRADQPEAIFVPNESYPELRREVLESECFRNYRAVDDDPKSPLRVRRDLRKQYLTGRASRPTP